MQHAMSVMSYITPQTCSDAARNECNVWDEYLPDIPRHTLGERGVKALVDRMEPPSFIPETSRPLFSLRREQERTFCFPGKNDS